MHDMQPDHISNGITTPEGNIVDNEGAMAKADLYKLANYSFKLFKKIDDGDQLEAWVQAKITKAADYIASVYHYLEYEMEFSEYGKKIENSDMYSESQKAELKNKLMEAKEKLKALKLQQAEKIKEEKSSTGGEITRGKGFTRHTHNPDRFSDEPHGEESSKVKGKSAADKAGDKAADKAAEKEGKAWEKRFGKGSVTRVKDGKKVDEAAKSPKAKKDYDKDGKIESEKDEVIGSRRRAAGLDEAAEEKRAPAKKKERVDTLPSGAKVKTTSVQGWQSQKADKEAQRKWKGDKDLDEAKELKGNQKKLDVDNDGDIEGDDLADLRAGKKKVKESAKPSAGMTKKEKSAVVKKAKAGKDIGKPGKGFKDVEAAAKKGGAKDPKAVAAAAMWKNAKKKVAENIEQVAQPEGEVDLGEGGSQVDQLKAMLADPKYANNPVAKAQLEKRLSLAKDRQSLDKGEVVGKDGMPIPVLDPDAFAKKNPNFKEEINESADLTRMKEFLIRLNG